MWSCYTASQCGALCSTIRHLDKTRARSCSLLFGSLFEQQTRIFLAHARPFIFREFADANQNKKNGLPSEILSTQNFLGLVGISLALHDHRPKGGSELFWSTPEGSPFFRFASANSRKTNEKPISSNEYFYIHRAISAGRDDIQCSLLRSKFWKHSNNLYLDNHIYRGRATIINQYVRFPCWQST